MMDQPSSKTVAMANETSKHSKVQLVPWDPANEQHFKRMVEQRHDCGWAQEDVPQWREQALNGKRIMYWIKLADHLPNKEEILKPHFEEFPLENEELVDTATSVAGTTRMPTQEKFFPIGHVGLQVGNEPAKQFDIPELETAIWIKSLYISFALHSQGLGRSSMAATERLAALPPLSADLLALDTVESSFQLNEDHLSSFWEGRGRKRPDVPKANQEWYVRQGYEVVKVVQNAIEWKHPVTGETHPLPLVFLSKKLV